MEPEWRSFALSTRLSWLVSENQRCHECGVNSHIKNESNMFKNETPLFLFFVLVSRLPQKRKLRLTQLPVTIIWK